MKTTALLLIGLLCDSAVRVVDAGCPGFTDPDHSKCRATHRDGIPDGRCFGSDCCLAITGVGEVPSCSGDYEVENFDNGGWGLGSWQSYGCCKSSPGPIIGLIIGLIASIAGCVACCCCCKQQKTCCFAKAAPPAPPAVQPMPMQPAMGIQMQSAQAVAVPVQGMIPPPVMQQPSMVPKFDPNTGHPIAIPKFDPNTGAQNW